MDLRYEPVDVEAAVQQGLRQRRDLAITRCMLRSLNSNSLPSARAILKGADFGVGNPISPATSGLCHRKQDYSLEINMRRCQLQIVLADQTRAAAEEIRASALAYEAAMREAVLNSQRYSLLLQQLSDLRQLRQSGKASLPDVTEGELNVVEARGRFAVKILEAHAAEARVRQAMELMADECGNAPHLLGACHECSPCAGETTTRRGLLRGRSTGGVSQNEPGQAPAHPGVQQAPPQPPLPLHRQPAQKQVATQKPRTPMPVHPAHYEYDANAVSFELPPAKVKVEKPAATSSKNNDSGSDIEDSLSSVVRAATEAIQYFEPAASPKPEFADKPFGITSQLSTAPVRRSQPGGIPRLKR